MRETQWAADVLDSHRLLLVPMPEMNAGACIYSIPRADFEKIEIL